MGRQQMSTYDYSSDTMIQDVSERTRKHLEASHHCFNASTFKKKLDFFDTCIDIDNEEETMEVRAFHDEACKGWTAKKAGSKSMRHLHESTMDFLIEDDVVVEKHKTNLRVNKKTDHEHSGALEALFTMEQNATPRPKSASSTGSLTSGKRSRQLSKLFTRRKDKGIQKDAMPEEVEQNEGDNKIAPLLVVAKPIAPTEAPISHFSSGRQLQPDEQDQGSLPEDETVNTTNVDATVPHAETRQLETRGKGAMQTTDATGSLSTEGKKEPEKQMPQNSPTSSPTTSGKHRGKGIRRNELYKSRQSSRRSVTDGSSEANEDDQRGKRHTIGRRQGSRRRIVTATVDGNSSRSEERKSPRKGSRRRVYTEPQGEERILLSPSSDHRPRSHRSSNDPLSKSDHRVRRRRSVDPISRSKGRTGPTSPAASNEQSNGVRSRRRKTTDPLSQTEHNHESGRRRSASRNARSRQPHERRSMSMGAGRRSHKKINTSSPNLRRRDEPNKRLSPRRPRSSRTLSSSSGSPKRKLSTSRRSITPPKPRSSSAILNVN